MSARRLGLQPRRSFLQALGLGLGAMPQLALAEGLQFPRDCAAHPAHSLEWWYLTGLLSEAKQASPRFGYQLTFFRIKGPAPPEHPSRFAARQLLLGHIAVTDLAAGKLHHDQRLARSGLGLAIASELDCDVRLRDWFLRRQDASGYRAGFASKKGGMSGGSNANKRPDFALDLQLKTTQEPLLQGRQGLSRKGPEPTQFSHYYSQVQLLTEGQLQLGDKRYALSGRSWLDHEWSDNLLGGGNAAKAEARAVGWDWAGINMADGSALTVFRLRRADGSQLWAGGSWRRPGAEAQDFSPEQVKMTPLRQWRSPQSTAKYPVEWQIETPVGTHVLRALLEDQEVDARLSTGMRYWEGPAELRSADGRPLGHGYLEMTGYAGAMKLLQRSD